jgi:hypothetical protein
VGEKVPTAIAAENAKHLPLDLAGFDPFVEVALHGTAAKAEQLLQVCAPKPLRAGLLVIAWDGQSGQPIRNV